MSASVGRTPTVGLGDCISQNCIVVPNHQRDYSWTPPNVRAFIDDIEKALKSKSQIYFCGLMVFTRSSPRFLKVLDGQQRLATTLMIFSAIRNWLRQNSAFKDDEIKDTDGLIQNQLLTTKFIGKPGPADPKLTLTVPNNEYFQKCVIQAIQLSELERLVKKIPDRDRNKHLLNAALLINRHIDETAKQYPDIESAHEYFVKLIQYICNEVQIVELVLENDAAAYTIFETLNDRGLELAPLDLLKNYLFSKAAGATPGTLADLEGRWSDMMLLLGTVKQIHFCAHFGRRVTPSKRGLNFLGNLRRFIAIRRKPTKYHWI
jgi:uncharacterized protein with ParB-like and HNH nuclease domain